MRCSFGIERLGVLLAISAGQNQKVYLGFFGQIVTSVISFLLRQGMVSLFIHLLFVDLIYIYFLHILIVKLRRNPTNANNSASFLARDLQSYNILKI